MTWSITFPKKVGLKIEAQNFWAGKELFVNLCFENE
jgi:hypothetical protein